MTRILVVTHSSDPQDSVLWRDVIQAFSNVDLVMPRFRDFDFSAAWPQEWQQQGRIRFLRAVEPRSSGHSSLWIKGIRTLVESKNYALLHAAMEPWSIIPQFFVNKLPTVVHGAESVIQGAPRLLRLRRTGLGRVLRNIAGLATWGQTSLDAFIAAGLPATTPRSVIPMGIPDPRLFSPTPIPSLANGVRLLYIGRLVPEKGVSTIIQALGDWSRPDTQLRIVGSGPEEIHLRNLASRVKTATITFTGPGDREMVASAMAWAHVVIVPSLVTSRWKEQWGRVAVEAIASGRPCVVSDSGELPLLSPFPESVFAASNAGELARKIHDLTSSEKRLEALATKQISASRKFEARRLLLDLSEFWGRSLEFARIAHSSTGRVTKLAK